MASREAEASNWQSAQPAVLALVLGLFAGPYISNALGWQVTSGTASARARADVVERLASVCAAQARMEMPDPSKLDQPPELAWRRNGRSCRERLQQRLT